VTALKRYLRAQNVTAALLKRLAHRNANVQLYSLSLADSLVKNCKVDLRREVASKAFMSGVERLIMDRVRYRWLTVQRVLTSRPDNA
jgi:signal transducing adaptor molecule